METVTPTIGKENTNKDLTQEASTDVEQLVETLPESAFVQSSEEELSPIGDPIDDADEKPANAEGQEETETVISGEANVEKDDNVADEGTEPIEDAVAKEEVLPNAIENIPAANDDEIASKMQKKSRKMSRRKRRKLEKRQRILNWAEKKDIRYRGIFSYRGLRIIAWLIFLVSQVGVLMALCAKINPDYAEKVGAWAIVLPLARNFMTPLFLMAAFATILNNSRKFSSLLITYGGFTLIFYALFCLLHDRYMVGIMMVMGEMTKEEAVKMVDMIIAMLCKNGYFSFNIFVDLFLCTLFTFFMVYRPKKVFVGKKLIVFRLFAILPVVYEIGSIVVKALASLGTIDLPTHVYPLLTTKPPMTFLIFIALTFFIKKREWLYRRNGKTHEEYQAFLGTNLNSLQFSTFVTNQFIVVAIIDVILAIAVGIALEPRFASAEDPFSASITAVSSWGLGACLPLLVVTPFIMLFSYTRTHKDTKMDLIINLLGIIGMALVYLEGLYQAAIYEVDVFKGLLEGVLGV